MKSRIRRWLLGLLVILLAVELVHVALVVFPQPLFRHKARFDGFTVYSNGELPEDMVAQIEDAGRRVRAMEFYQPGENHRLFLCRTHRLYAFYALLTRLHPASQAINVSMVDNTFLSEVGIRAMRARTGGEPRHSRFEGSFAQAIAHEVAHEHAIRALGFWRHRSLPGWKTEGYAEYAANLAPRQTDPSYCFGDRVRLLLDAGYWSTRRPLDRTLYRWQVLVEYLFDVRGLSPAELADEAVGEQQTWVEMLDWYSANPSVCP